MRKAERFAKQKIRRKNVAQTILSLRSSNSVENRMSAVVIKSERTSNDVIIFRTLIKEDTQSRYVIEVSALLLACE